MAYKISANALHRINDFAGHTLEQSEETMRHFIHKDPQIWSDAAKSFHLAAEELLRLARLNMEARDLAMRLLQEEHGATGPLDS